MRRAAFLLTLLLLAGCASKSTDQGGVAATLDVPVLQGFVLDAALHPLAGANVTIAAANATAVTDGNGHYAFKVLPGAEALVAVAQMAGYQPLGKSVQLSLGNSTLLNFTLTAVPTLKPYMELQQFKGFLSCQAITTANDQDTKADCGTSTTENKDLWEFNVGPNVAGVVLETVWSAKSSLAQFLNATVETVGLGDQDAGLSSVQGASILRAAVTHDQCLKYYPQGGTIRIKLSAATNVDEQEQAAGFALAAQQEFKVVASIFYVTPPDPAYTAGSG